MPLGTLHAVFGNHLNAASAIESAKNQGFTSGKFSIIGSDSDSFRTATATLQSKRIDKTIFWFGIIGAAIGCTAGFLGLPHFPERQLYFLMFVPLGAMLSGLAVGMMIGMIAGAILRLDNIPEYEANVRLGNVNDGDMAVSVSFNSDKEREQLLEIFSIHGGKYLSMDLPVRDKQEHEPYQLPLGA